MPQAFVQQIERIQARQQRRRWIVATCWALAALAITALMLAALDRALGTHELGGRVMTTIVWVVASLRIGKHWIIEVRRPAISLLEVAEQVEHSRPELRDRVTSALQFSSQQAEEIGAGSESLRRAVVLSASQEVEDFEWDQLVPRRPLRKSLLAIACVFAIATALTYLQPNALGTGLARLTNPLGSTHWPRQHNLQFIDPPSLLAVGDDLQLTLHDTLGPLPESVSIHYRYWQNGRWQRETRTLATGESQLEIRRPNIVEPLEFRATGGDHHSMPWQNINVSVPPALTSLQLTVTPPRYTGLPKQPLAEPFRVLSGSSLQLTGQLDQAVTAVALCSTDAMAIPATCDSQRQTFSIPSDAWQVATTAASTERRDYWLQLTTIDGLQVRSEQTIHLEILPDHPPEVNFLSPTKDLTLVPAARVEMIVESADEIGTQQIQLNLRRTGELEAEEELVSIHRGPEVPTNSQADSLTAALAGKKRQQRVEYVWDLAPLKLQPGSIVEVEARATDYQPLEGKTVRPLRWTIVSLEEMMRRFGAREAWILNTLQRARQRQRVLQNRTEDRLHADSKSSNSPSDWAHAELFEQRELSDLLALRSESVAAVAAELLVDLKRNRLDRPDSPVELSKRLSALELQLRELAAGPLPVAERLLSKLTRSAEPKQTELLTNLQLEQSKVVAELDRALTYFERYNALHTIERELAFLRSDQQQLLDHCRTDIASVWLKGKESHDRSPGRGAWPHETRRQRQLATRLAELVLRMEQTGEALLDEDPTAAERLAATARMARETAVQATLRSAADRLSKNQLGRALSLQQKAVAQLQALLDRLSDPETNRVEQQIADLRKTQHQLQQLQQQLSQHAAEWAAAQKLPADERQKNLQRLKRQREQLAEKIELEARKLERLQAPRAAETTRRAADSLRQEQGNGEKAKEAKQQLDDAQQKITDARRRMQVALARLQMERLDRQLRSLVGSQQALLDEIVRLEATRSAATRSAAQELTSAGQRSVMRLADSQTMLSLEVTEQAETLSSLPVMAHLLGRASSSMDHVAARLRQHQTDSQTQQLASRALQELERIADAVKKQKDQLDDQAGQGGSGGGEKEGQSGGGAEAQQLQLAIGQVKLLRSLQTELRERTRQLEQRQSEQERSPQSLIEVAQRLAIQQQELTQLARKLAPEPPLEPLENLLPNFEQELEDSLKDDWQPIETIPKPFPRSNQP